MPSNFAFRNLASSIFWFRGAVAAVLLKFEAVFFANVKESLATPLLAMRITYMVYSIVLASQVVGAVVLIGARCWTVLRRLQPGHWLVLISAFTGLLEIVLWTILHTLCGVTTMEMGLYLGYLAISGFVAATANMTALMLLRDARRWKILFAALALSSAASASGAAVSLIIKAATGRGYPPTFSLHMTEAISPYFYGVLVLGIVFAAIRDRRNRVPRDWLHALGAFTLALEYAVELAWDVFRLLSRGG